MEMRLWQNAFHSSNGVYEQEMKRASDFFDATVAKILTAIGTERTLNKPHQHFADSDTTTNLGSKQPCDFLEFLCISRNCGTCGKID